MSGVPRAIEVTNTERSVPSPISFCSSHTTGTTQVQQGEPHAQNCSAAKEEAGQLSSRHTAACDRWLRRKAQGNKDKTGEDECERPKTERYKPKIGEGLC